jgi:predicted enzyme related to lactoylglutathione lyase
MSSVLTEIVIESSDPARAAEFWSAALGWALREYQPGNVPWTSASGNPERHDLKLVFVRAPESREPRNRLFVNPSGCELSEEIKRLCDLGAGLAATKGASTQEIETPLVALVDPGGTRFTILPARAD